MMKLLLKIHIYVCVCVYIYIYIYIYIYSSVILSAAVSLMICSDSVFSSKSTKFDYQSFLSPSAYLAGLGINL